MRSNNVMGIIFCNTNDDRLPELTPLRTMGSVPFGCRYRLVDFSLSNMVNAGISKVGLVTKRNYQSLADHVGNGRPWDLARKKGGLSILSPFMYAHTGVYKGKIDALYNARDYIAHSREQYVVIANSNVVANIDLEEMIERHIDSEADITVAYKENITTETYLNFNNGRVSGITDAPGLGENCAYLDMMLLKRELLLSLIDEATTHNYTNLNTDILGRKAKSLGIYGYEVTGTAFVINSMISYFDASMKLLDKETRDEIFDGRPVYTKLRDDMPTRYGMNAKVGHSLIADGCVIEGEVKNSIIFRGVNIGKGAKLENCIIMQSCEIGENTHLTYVVADKNVSFKDGRTLMGCHSFPMVIGKGLIV